MQEIILLLQLLWAVFTSVQVPSKINLEFVSIVWTYQEEGDEDNAEETTNIREDLIKLLEASLIRYGDGRFKEVENGISVDYLCISTL
jgi:hypothetical protein